MSPLLRMRGFLYAGFAAALLIGSAAAVADDEIERVRAVYAEPDGQEQWIELFLPPEASGETTVQRPVVVMMHGGAWLFRLQNKLVWFSERLAEQGYVAAIIDYRLLPRHPFPAALHDAKAAVRWLRLNAETYEIDPDRIAALGMSAGGHLAALLATTKPADGFEGGENLGPSSEVQAAVAVYAPLDLSVYENGGGALDWIGSRYIGRFLGGMDNGRDDMTAAETASPINYIDSDSSPMLLVHGTWDQIVPSEHSKRFYEELREHGVPARLFEASGQFHGFARFPTRLRQEVLDEILSFLGEYLD